MGLYIDSANLAEVKEALSWGFLSGVTTNPTILAREKGDPLAILKKIVKLEPFELFAQVKFASLEKMRSEALKLHAFAPDKIIIKIPFSPDGLRLIPILREMEIRTCLTAIFSVSQGCIGALAGADSLAVYVGRITRNGGNGHAVVKKISDFLVNENLAAKILAASIPSVEDAEALLSISKVDITAPKKILDEMIKHQLTDKAIEQFNKAI